MNVQKQEQFRRGENKKNDDKKKKAKDAKPEKLSRKDYEEKLEKLAVSDSLRSIQYAEVVVLLLDAQIPFEKQDLTLADLVEREGRAMVIAVNKWDTVEDKNAKLAELREQYIGRLLLRAHRAFSDQAAVKLQARGHGGLGLAHTGLLVNLDLDGTRITTLAERAGITKQAVGQLVHDLEAKGYVARAVAPADRRATLIRGWQFLRDAHGVKQAIEAEYTAKLGDQGMATLRLLLIQLLDDTPVVSADEGG